MPHFLKLKQGWCLSTRNVNWIRMTYVSTKKSLLSTNMKQCTLFLLLLEIGSLLHFEGLRATSLSSDHAHSFKAFHIPWIMSLNLNNFKLCEIKLPEFPSQQFSNPHILKLLKLTSTVLGFKNLECSCKHLFNLNPTKLISPKNYIL